MVAVPLKVLVRMCRIPVNSKRQDSGIDSHIQNMF